MLVLLNIVGIQEAARLNIFLAVIDFATQLFITAARLIEKRSAMFGLAIERLEDAIAFAGVAIVAKPCSRPNALPASADAEAMTRNLGLAPPGRTVAAPLVGGRLVHAPMASTGRRPHRSRGRPVRSWGCRTPCRHAC